MRILVVDDEPRVVALLRRVLEREGYAVDVAHGGEQALLMAVEVDYDAIVLDVMIPGPDGFEVCKELRRRGRWSPILLLTAKGDVEDRVTGLDAGADDYLSKPFSVSELAARLRSLTRRVLRERPVALKSGGLMLDPTTRRVERNGEPIELTPKEYALLDLFMRHAGEALTRRSILDHVWDFAYDGGSNVVDVYVRYLRDKIDRPFGAKSIETVRGIGYRWVHPLERSTGAPVG